MVNRRDFVKGMIGPVIASACAAGGAAAEKQPAGKPAAEKTPEPKQRTWLFWDWWHV